MSQVIKAQNGTKTPEAKKSKHDNRYGHYIVDGVTYDVNDDFLRDYANSAKQYNDNSTSILANDILNTLRSGKDVSINTLNNSISGVDNYSFDDRDIAKSQELNQARWTRKTQRIARRNANRNSSLHQFHQGVQNLGNIRFTDPVEAQENVSVDRIGLFRNRGWFDYNTDAQGNQIYSTAPTNASAENYLSQIQDALSLTEDEARKKYNWEDYSTNWTNLQDWKSRYGQNYDWNALLTRIKSNQITQEDEDLLSTLGFQKPQTQGDQAGQQTAVPRSPEGSGFDNAALEQAGYFITKGEDGNYYLATQDANGNYNLISNNIYLKGTPWAQNTPWANGAVYQGRLYNSEQVLDRNNPVGQAIQSQLFDKMRTANDPESVRQAILNSRWTVYGTSNPYNIGEDNTYVSGQHHLNGFDNLFTNGTYYWNDITNQFNAPEGTTILSYYNQNNRDVDNSLREQYAIYHNGESQIFNNITALQNYLNQPGIEISRAENYNYGNPIHQYRYLMNDGNRYFVLPTQYIIPGDESTKYNLYRDTAGNYYTDYGNQKMKKLQGRAILEKIKNGSVSAQELRNGFAEEDNRPWFDDGRLFGINLGTSDKNPYKAGSYDQFFGFYKKGGKIEKKQIGGLFHQGNAGKMQDNKPVESNVGQPQKLNADKKLKTSTDSMNVAAGALDAAGLATSWIPGLGTAISVLGSLTRLSADIQKDGFQWKDLGNFGINLGLDALTLIPAAGAIGKAAKTGIKAAKAAKDVTKTRKVIDTTAKILNRARPVIATTGTAAGMSQIAGAINDAKEGEFTSESMGNLLSGLGNTAAGVAGLGRLYKTAKATKAAVKPGEAKPKFEVKEGDGKIKTAAKKAGNAISNTTQKIKGGLPSTIKLMYSPKKVEKLVTENWQQLAKSDNKFSRRLAGEYLSKFGPQISKDIEYSAVNIRPNWMRPKFDVRTSSVSLKNARQIRANRGILNKMYHNGVNSTDTAKTYVQNNLTPDKQAYWLDLLNKRSRDFNSLFKKLSKLSNDPRGRVQVFESFKFKKGGKIVKAQRGTRLPIGYVSNNNDNGISGFPSTIGMVWQYPQGKSSNMPWYTANPNGDFTPYAPSYHFMSQLQSFNDAPSEAVSKPQVKTRTTNIPIPTLNGGTLDATTITADRLTLPTFSPYATTQMSQTTLDIPTVVQTSNPNPVIDTDSSETKSKETGIQTGEKSQWLSNLKINPDDLIAATELARSITANNRMFRDLQDANKAVYKDMPTEIYDRYQDHITPIYNEMAQRQRSYIPVSTDQLTNYAIRQSRQDAADQMEAEGKLKASEAYSQYLANDLAARRAYAEDRRNTAFYNRQMAVSKIMRDAEIDQMRRLANNQSISNAVMEFRNKLNLDRNKKEAFMQQQDQIAAQNAYNEVFNAALQPWVQKFNTLTPEQKAQYGSAEGYWMDQDMTSYTDAITKARNAGLMTNQNNWNNYMWYHRINPVDLNISTPVTMTASRSYKSGGKTSAQYTRRHYGPKPDEAIWIQHNKATAEAIKQLRDSVIKLFMLNLK